MKIVSSPVWTIAALAAVALLFSAGVGAVASGQTPQTQDHPQTQPQSQPASSPAPESYPAYIQALQGRVAHLEQDKDLDAKVKAEAIDCYRQALVLLKDAQDWTVRAEENAKAALAAPAKLAALRAGATSQPASMPTTGPEVSRAQLEQLWAQTADALAEATKANSIAADEPKRRVERKVQLTQDLAAAQGRLVEAEREAAPAAGSSQAPEVVSARSVLLQCKKAVARQEILCDQKELLRLDAEMDLVLAQRDAASGRMADLQGRLDALSSAVNARRAEDARQAAEQAQHAAAEAHPALRQLADEVASLTAQRAGAEGLAARIERATGDHRQASDLLTQVQAKFRDITQKVEASGMTPAVCSLMRKTRVELPDVHLYERRISQRQEEIANVQLQLIDIDEQVTALGDVKVQAARLVARAQPPVAPQEAPALQASAVKLLEAKRDGLASLAKDYDDYFHLLIDLDGVERQLLKEVEKLNDYVSERILWTRSTAALRISDLPQAGAALCWLARPKAWVDMYSVLARQAAARPQWVVGILLGAGLLFFRRKILSRLAATAPAHGGVTGEADSFARTVHAFFLTLLLSLPIPAILVSLSRLLDAPDAGDLAHALGGALVTTAIIVGNLWFLTQICRPSGLAEAHFNWSGPSLAAARGALRALLLVVAPVLLLYSVLREHNNDAWRDSLGRMAFLVYMLAVALFVHRMLWPKGVVVREAGVVNHRSLIFRCRHLWYPLGMVMPLVLLGLGWTGYFYTALVLSSRLLITFWMLTMVMILHAAAGRGLKLALRRLALRRIRRAAKPQSPQAATAGAPATAAEASQEPDVTTLRTQSDQLLRSLSVLILVVGAWWIWAGPLRALGMLQHVDLWGQTVSVSGAGADGSTQMSLKVVPVTLADLVIALVILVVTYVAAKDAPGLLEVSVLQRLPISPAGRHAIGALLRYASTIVGIVIALDYVGVGWSSVQWLVAAMTVGLGFGLQEIFANFISGLILLFERPIRLGDTVTVGDVTGTVTRMRIRATTITDWNRRDLIVPNKDFITGRVVNWTLSDRLIRIVLPVQVPAQCDLDKAEKALMGAAQRNPLVLKSPAPQVVLSTVSDTGLKFELRVFIQAPENLLQARQDQVQHELNMAIEKALREAKIA